MSDANAQKRAGHPAKVQRKFRKRDSGSATAAKSVPELGDGRTRAVIDAVLPSIDGGRFPLKRAAAQAVSIEAHCFADGHDRIRVVLDWHLKGGESMPEVEMTPAGNDVWLAEFIPPVPGRYEYSIIAWVDPFESWRSDLAQRVDQADIFVAIQVGSSLIADAMTRASAGDAMILSQWRRELDNGLISPVADFSSIKTLALNAAHSSIVAKYANRELAATVTRELVADRERAVFSSWYELFPRSAADEEGRHGTFKDVAKRLPYLAQMGFDVLYFPPIHPIGRINRKGANNTLTANPADVGSPWAIGSAEGGHKSVLPQLGTLEDFRDLSEKARGFGLEIAHDLAFQCAPDHPYVKAHPTWFRHRPDGSVQYAENPPKKYQDIYPFDFESEDWRGLWEELKSVVDFWVDQGVRIFRVDNPHTKAFDFWEWLITETKRPHPDLIFLAEAFTRPKIMHRLAKIGFTQSYTYFTWRNTKQELVDYFTDLASAPSREYYRPNVWPNTPDILPETLQSGLRQVFEARLILATTLAASYGIYGPAYELLEGSARGPGSEEYGDSEKYQLRHWNLNRRDNLSSLVARLNRIRRENVALHSDKTLRFCPIDNDQLIAYSKVDLASGNIVLVVVNLDPYHVQSGWIDLDIDALQLDRDQPYQAHDLLSDQRYLWRGRRNYVLLDPLRIPAHVFRLRRRVRSEHDFDYYL
jgi:starch synthase (maltosyl-transferring)